MYLDPESIINKEEFKLIEDNSICSICNGIIYSPIQCIQCENCFCSSCLEDWKKKKGENSCPFKCEKCNFKPSRILKNILSKLKFKCNNGCNEEILYSDLESHYEEKCPKLNYKEKYLEYKQKYFDLLKKFNEMEIKNKEKNFFKSKFHSHNLENLTLKNTPWFCNICLNHYSQKSETRFRCQNCDFDICGKCIEKEEKNLSFGNLFMSKTHRHALYKILLENNCICDICRSKIPKGIKSFRCKICDFDLCNNCREKE